VSVAERPWGITFVVTAYLLLIMEAIGTYVGVHFLWIAKETQRSGTAVIPVLGDF
jgi:hypothetical protein